MADGSGHSPIIIDDPNVRGWPPHVFRVVGQLVLSCAFLVFEHLTLL
jgi:hypothetical protein